MYAWARVIVVDRLHAHVLAVLLGTPHVVMDNNYRKISAIYEEYSGEFSTAHYATDIASARLEAERLLEA
jgi:pyruvyl transferase EpsO